LCSIAASFTAYYSSRLLIISFARAKNSAVVVRGTIVPLQFISTPLILLAYLSIFVGFVFKDVFVGFGSPFFLSSISSCSEHDFIVDSEFLFSTLKFLPVLLSFVGFLGAFFSYGITNYKII